MRLKTRADTLPAPRFPSRVDQHFLIEGGGSDGHGVAPVRFGLPIKFEGFKGTHAPRAGIPALTRGRRRHLSAT